MPSRTHRSPLERALHDLPAQAGVLRLDLAEARPVVLDHEGLWHITAFAGDRPLGHRWVDAPDRVLAAEFVQLLFHAELLELRRLDLQRRIAARLPGGTSAPPRRTVTVAICTRRRREQVAALLGDLQRLDPRPLEVLVVDNDPGDQDVAGPAAEYGARYLRLERPGLNRARAAAIQHARGEIVAFLDDDCRVPPRWLAPVDRLFARADVAAATGPALPLRLETPAQIAFEQLGGFGRGYRSRTADWRDIPPSSSTSLGSGNDMFLRRDAVLALDEPFPLELDAGTPTESGGDLYVMALLLHAGGRIAFEPELWVLHEHRRDGRGLDRVIRGYGTGMGAGLLTLARRRGEVEVVVTAGWFWQQLRVAAARRAVGRAGPLDLASAVTYLDGAARAPRALARARRPR